MKLIKNALGLVILVAVLSSAAMADGCYIPARAYPVNPSIPTQRALITFRNGVETLVVESTYQSDSPDVGWILPLPAEPTKLEQADGGLLRSISMSLRPEITHDLSEVVKGLTIAAGCLVPFVLVVLLVKDAGRRDATVRTLAKCVITLVIFGALLASITLSSMAGISSHGVVGITEVSSQRVGNYEATVLKAADGGAVSAWLEANSLRGLDAQAKVIVDDYAARKWCFVVARLSRPGSGVATPHPIAATFPSASIVYPMKLTAIAGSVTHVELFVACEKEAAAAGFECVVADRFREVADRIGTTLAHPMSEENPESVLPEPHYGATATGLVIGSPDAGAFLWNGCVLTKLVADMKPQQMGQDVAIGQRDLVPYRKHVFSPTGRNEIIVSVSLGAAILLMLAVLIAYHGPRRPARKHLRVFAYPVVLVAMVCIGLYLLLPTVAVHSGRGMGRFMFARDMQCFAARHLDGQMSDEELKGFPAILKVGGMVMYKTNPFTGQEMQFERTPGNFSVRRLEGHAYFCAYDEDGREWRALLPDRKTAETEP
jgi:hypothetical protein